jgi:hypothetical protein
MPRNLKNSTPKVVNSTLEVLLLLPKILIVIYWVAIRIQTVRLVDNRGLRRVRQVL